MENNDKRDTRGRKKSYRNRSVSTVLETTTVTTASSEPQESIILEAEIPDFTVHAPEPSINYFMEEDDEKSSERIIPLKTANAMIARAKSFETSWPMAANYRRV